MPIIDGHREKMKNAVYESTRGSKLEQSEISAIT